MQIDRDANQRAEPGEEPTRRASRRRNVVWLIPYIALASVSANACKDNEDSTICSADGDCGSGSCIVAPISQLEFCADVARGCPTGHRWASSAGDGLAGFCVDPNLVDAGVDAPTNELVDSGTDAP